VHIGVCIDDAPEHTNDSSRVRMKIETFVFDFDGTLAELRLDFADMKRRLSALAQSCHAPTPPPPVLPVLERLEWLEKSIRQSSGGSDNGFRSRAMAMISDMECRAAERGSLFPFTRPLLKTLLNKGIKTAIITRNCDLAVRIVFPDIAEYCCAYFCRDHVTSPKPDPAHLLHALESIGGDIRSAIMIGDHPLDIETGKSAGVMTAGVCSGSSRGEELLDAGADRIADNCLELLESLSKEGLV
jgi:phosphoglycolate phosphatase